MIPDLEQATILQKEEKYEEAVAIYEAVLEKDPDNLYALQNLASIYQLFRLVDRAIACLRKLIRLKPAEARFFAALGAQYISIGDTEKALQMMRTALKKDPSLENLYSNYLQFLENSSKTTALELVEAKKSWGKHFLPHLAARRHKASHPEKQLRLGYISGDFRSHSAALGFLSLLLNYDRENFWISCYSNLARSKEDEITASIRGNVDQFLDIDKLSDDELEQKVREDEIDILIDLSGYTMGNRLKFFARRAAALQLHLVGSSPLALPCFDYSFVAKNYLSEEDELLYPEKILALPLYFGAELKQLQLEESPLPALFAGYINFGSFNVPSKLNAELLDTWAELLRRLPLSKILFKAREFSFPYFQKHLIDHFANLGIGKERLDFMGASSQREHIAAYSKVDIALDPFPRLGGVSSLEAKWMGVPVLSLEPSSVNYSLTACVSQPLGLRDWIASTKEDYLAIALEKVSDLEALSILRKELRDRVDKTFSLFPSYCEEAYRSIWREECFKNKSIN